MESEAIDWEQDLPLDDDEAYRSLVRSLSRTDGFALLFVRCSPVQGDRIITDVRADLPSKTIEVLELKESIDNLYDHVAALPNRDQINVLFIKGIEYSIFAYEDREMNDINLRSQSSVFGGTWQSIPRVLGHLNLSRERFRDNFRFCFVFLLPEFALRYFIRRAPDFFDWRSNIYEFPTDTELLEQESLRVLSEGDYNQYLSWSYSQRIQKVIEINDLLTEPNQTSERKVDFLIKQGDILVANEEYEKAIGAYDRALQIEPDNHRIWYSRGIALFRLGRYDEAMAAYDKALKVNPNSYASWYNRGIVLDELGQYEKAVDSYTEAIKIKPNHYRAWNNRSNTLLRLEQTETAILGYTMALKIKPDFHKAFLNMGIGLNRLKCHLEEIQSYNKALKIAPSCYEALYRKGIALYELKFYREAINCYDTVLLIKPNLHEVWNNRGFALQKLGCFAEAIASFDKALEIHDKDYLALLNRGIALSHLGLQEDAIQSYDRAISIKPDNEEILYRKHLALSALGISSKVSSQQIKTSFLNQNNYENSKVVDPQSDEIDNLNDRDNLANIDIEKDNEGIESALRRFKKRIQKAGLLADIRRAQYHETAGEKSKRKAENTKLRGRFRRRDV